MKQKGGGIYPTSSSGVIGVGEKVAIMWEGWSVLKEETVFSKIESEGSIMRRAWGYREVYWWEKDLEFKNHSEQISEGEKWEMKSEKCDGAIKALELVDGLHGDDWHEQEQRL